MASNLINVAVSLTQYQRVADGQRRAFIFYKELNIKRLDTMILRCNIPEFGIKKLYSVQVTDVQYFSGDSPLSPYILVSFERVGAL